MAGINIELPAFAPDDLNDPKARQGIISYLYQLAEQVKYLSTHIDGENMTDDFQQEMISTASASVRDELSGTLTKFETQIEQNAREISTKPARRRGTPWARKSKPPPASSARRPASSPRA